jgi:hypothetical protein
VKNNKKLLFFAGENYYIHPTVITERENQCSIALKALPCLGITFLEFITPL